MCVICGLLEDDFLGVRAGADDEDAGEVGAEFWRRGCEVGDLDAVGVEDFGSGVVVDQRGGLAVEVDDFFAYDAAVDARIFAFGHDVGEILPWKCGLVFLLASVGHNEYCVLIFLLEEGVVPI